MSHAPKQANVKASYSGLIVVPYLSANPFQVSYHVFVHMCDSHVSKMVYIHCFPPQQTNVMHVRCANPTSFLDITRTVFVRSTNMLRAVSHCPIRTFLWLCQMLIEPVKRYVDSSRKCMIWSACAVYLLLVRSLTECCCPGEG